MVPLSELSMVTAASRMTAPEGSVMVPRSDAVACEYALTVPNSTTNQTAANRFIPGTSRMASSIVVKETELLPYTHTPPGTGRKRCLCHDLTRAANTHQAVSWIALQLGFQGTRSRTRLRSSLIDLRQSV